MAPRKSTKKKVYPQSSPAKSRSLVAGTKGKIPAARRCQKCPNKPLRSQCVHTKAGRAYLEQSRANSLPPSSPPPPSSPVYAPSSTLGLPSSPIMTPTQTSAFPTYNRFMIDPFVCDTGHTMSQQSGLDAGAFSIPSLPSTPQTGPAVPTTPAIIGVTSPPPSTPAPVTESSISPQTGSGRTRITADNPIYGVVEGAKQGNARYDIVRTKKLRPAQTDAREAGKRFHRGMRDLIIRVENLSKETGAWIYLAGQHVNGAKGFTNYASPRLRRDAKNELTDIQNRFNTMASGLITSRRREVVELSIALEKSNQERRAAQAALADLQVALDTPDLAATLTKDAFIAKLKTLIEINGGSSDT